MRIAVILIALSLPAQRVAAQDASELTSSTRIRVTSTMDSRAQIGTYQALTDTTLVLSFGVTSRAIPLSSISRLESSRGRKLSVVGALSGFIVGGVAGALAGCSANRDSYDVFCAGQSDTKVVLGAVLGGAAGATLGAVLFRREQWRTIDVARLRPPRP
jgi:hypothetical protein